MSGKPFVLGLSQVRIGRDDALGGFFGFEEHREITYEVCELEVVAAVLAHAPEVPAPSDLQIFLGDDEPVVRLLEHVEPARFIATVDGDEDTIRFLRSSSDAPASGSR